MAKRNQTIADIRYFECLSWPPAEGEADPYYAGEIYRGFGAEMNVFSTRIADKCSEHKVSVGRQSHLYILFTPSVPAGRIVPLSFQREIWQRYVAFGLPLSFNKKSAGERRSAIERATFKVLRTVARRGAKAIDVVAKLHKQAGHDLRLLVGEKKYQQLTLRVTRNYLPHKGKSTIWLEAMDRASGRSGEQAVASWTGMAVPRLKKILLKDGVVALYPRGSRASIRVKLDRILGPTKPSRRA